MYTLKLQKFEGPLDLLLELIESNKLEITEVSLAQVAQQYIDFLEKMDKAPIEYLAEFLLIASRLIFLKSKALLPKMAISEEEEKDIIALKRQLELYQKFRKIIPEMKKMFSSNYCFISRDIAKEKKIMFYPPSDIDAGQLAKYFEEIMLDYSENTKLPQEVLTKSISIKEKIDFIKAAMSARIKITFQEIIKESNSKSESIVSFLAILELLKKQFIQVEQQIAFGDIYVKKNSCHPELVSGSQE